MPRIEYCGPHAEVEVPSLGLVFTKGKAVDVDDDAAKDLLAQSGNYKRVGNAPKKETDK